MAVGAKTETIASCDSIGEAKRAFFDCEMQRIAARLELLPQFAYVPSLSPGWGTSDLIPRMFGVSRDPNVARIADSTELLAEAFDGRVQVVYPQMQGPLTNAVRVMEQTELGEIYFHTCGPVARRQSGRGRGESQRWSTARAQSGRWIHDACIRDTKSWARPRRASGTRLAQRRRTT